MPWRQTKDLHLKLHHAQHRGLAVGNMCMHGCRDLAGPVGMDSEGFRHPRRTLPIPKRQDRFPWCVTMPDCRPDGGGTGLRTPERQEWMRRHNPEANVGGDQPSRPGRASLSRPGHDARWRAPGGMAPRPGSLRAILAGLDRGRLDRSNAHPSTLPNHWTRTRKRAKPDATVQPPAKWATITVVPPSGCILDSLDAPQEERTSPCRSGPNRVGEAGHRRDP